MSYPYRQLALALIAAAPLAAQAEEGIDLSFSGFGTVGAVMTDTDAAQYRASVRQGKGADKSPDLGVDSRLGLPANLTLNPTYSIVAQGLMSRRDGQEGGQLEWLFGQAHVNSWLDARGGRMVLPTFMLSDTRNVGFASHWIHAPHEVYDNYPSTSFDGVEAVMHTDWQGVRFTLQPSWGKSNSNIYFGLPGKSKLEYKYIASLNLVAEYKDWKVRYGRVDGHDTTLSKPGLSLAATPKDMFTAVGLQYDNGSLLVLSEYTTRRQVGGHRFDSASLYVNAGYRLGTWTPYVGWGQLKPEGPAYKDPKKDDTYTAGVRWDIASTVALKYQYEAATPGLQFTGGSPAFEAANKRINVHSVALDFVF